MTSRTAAGTLAGGMALGGPRAILAALVLAALPIGAAGCAFGGHIAVQLRDGAPVVVQQSSTVELTPNRVQGTTTRAGQVIRIDCSVTGVFDVREATGSAVLIQLYVVHLRTGPLRRGTPYQLDCAGPVIVQLTTVATGGQATATDRSGLPAELAVQAPLSAIPIAFGKRLRAERGTQFALLSWPAASAGGYEMDLSFSLANIRVFREKVLYAALIACGRSKYFQPIRPLTTRMAQVAPFTIQPTPNQTSVSVPHLFGGIRSYGEATRTLSCAR
jgi:hypothetical protein